MKLLQFCDEEKVKAFKLIEGKIKDDDLNVVGMVQTFGTFVLGEETTHNLEHSELVKVALVGMEKNIKHEEPWALVYDPITGHTFKTTPAGFANQELTLVVMAEGTFKGCSMTIVPLDSVLVITPNIYLTNTN